MTCDIIRDLLPLYAEDLCSQDSRRLVEAHLAGCPDCRAALEELKEKPAPSPAAPLRALAGKLNRSRLRLAAFAAALALLLGTVVLYHVTTLPYMPYRPGLAAAQLVADGKLRVTGRGAAGIQSDLMVQEDGSQAILYLTFVGAGPGGGVLTSEFDVPRGVTPRVYYVYPNAEAVQLLGEPDPEGSFHVLPRLALAFYGMVTLAALASLALLWLLLRGRERARQLVGKIAVAPAAYLAGHLLIKGMRTASFHMMRDLAFILAAAAFTAAALWLAPLPGRGRTD